MVADLHPALPPRDERHQPLLTLDLRAHLLTALAALQQQPDTASVLAAGLDLVPAKKREQVMQLLTAPDTAAAGSGSADAAGGSMA